MNIIKAYGQEIKSKYTYKLTDEEFNDIRNEFYLKPTEVELKRELNNILYKKGTKLSNITKEYFKPLMAKVKMYHSKFTQEEVFNNKELVDDKRNTRNKATDLYDFYCSTFSFKKWHKRATSIERIKDALKNYSEDQIKLFIQIYNEDKLTTIKNKEYQYIKTCENFFWYDKWSKVKFIANFEWRELLSKPKQQVSTNNILDDKDNIDW